MTPRSTQQTVSAANAAEISPENLQFLCKTVYDGSGIVLDESKGYLLEARLVPLVRNEGASTLNDLCNLIRATGGQRLRQEVVEAMTTNETLFFRDVRPFEALEKAVFPEMIERLGSRRSLRVWSAACSSGQEPYSLAMMWLEMGKHASELEILGTDLADSILEKARAGRFMQLEVNRGLPAKYLVKYFTREGVDWEIKPDLRRMVQWRKFNLRDHMMGIGPMDIVLCRNVLIYFDLETKKQILANIRKALVPGGYLVLGASETTLGADETFIRRQIGSAIFYQNPGGG